MRYVEDEEGIRRSQADYTYGYGDALRDGVVRPVLFIVLLGHHVRRTSAGEQYSARLGEPLTKDMMKQAWRTALDPKGEWIPAVLQAADQRLTEVRRQVPDAGGLVIASDQTQARAYARHLRMITGKAATVVLSDDKDASERIDTFRENDDRWMVAVRMVSEGVDVPRLSVGVYATTRPPPYSLHRPLDVSCAHADVAKPPPCLFPPYCHCLTLQERWKLSATTLLTVRRIPMRKVTSIILRML